MHIGAIWLAVSFVLFILVIGWGGLLAAIIFVAIYCGIGFVADWSMNGDKWKQEKKPEE